MDLPTFDPAAITVEDQRGLPPPPPEGVLDVLVRGIRRQVAAGDPLGIKRYLPAGETTLKVHRFREPGYAVTLPRKLPMLK